MKDISRRLLSICCAILLAGTLALPVVATESEDPAQTSAAADLLAQPEIGDAEATGIGEESATGESGIAPQSETATVQEQAGSVPISPRAEEFRFEVTTPGPQYTEFLLPTAGKTGGFGKGYDWNIDWGDGNSGTGYTESNNPDGGAASPNSDGSNGISHDYAAEGSYIITITPNGSTDAWLGSFGFSSNTWGGTMTRQRNRDFVTDVLSPFTPLMTRSALELSAGPAPDNEWDGAFSNCTNLKSTGPGFSEGWDGITDAGGYFAAFLYSAIAGSDFTMHPDFALPPDLTTVGDAFASCMFANCNGAAFNMNATFNLPQNIVTVGEEFAVQMFYSCSGASFTMSDVFNLPGGIVDAPAKFAAWMFYDCTGAAFNMSEVFNIPQGITSVGDYFVTSLFNACNGGGFMVNDVFRLPRLPQAVIEANYAVFNNVLEYLNYSVPQKRSAISIINNPSTVTPPTIALSSDNYAFAGGSPFPDLALIDTSWGGYGPSAGDCVVTFDTNGVTEVSFPTETAGMTSTSLPALQSGRIGTPVVSYASGYTNHTWYTDPDGLYPWDILNDVIPAGTSTMTLYAYKPLAPTPANYTVLEHFGTWAGSGTTAARIDAEPSKFLGLYLSGLPVPTTGYGITTGSTVITLKESYLKTFVNGDYVFTAEYTDGTATPINLKVAVAGGGGGGGNAGGGTGANGSPGTGDSGGALLPLMGALLGLSLLAFAALPRKQKIGR